MWWSIKTVCLIKLTCQLVLLQLALHYSTIAEILQQQNQMHVERKRLQTLSSTLSLCTHALAVDMQLAQTLECVDLVLLKFT